MKMSNQNIGQIIKALRLKQGKTLREVAGFLEMDQAILSKMENGKRPISEKLIKLLATYFKEDGGELRKYYVVDKLYKIIECFFCHRDDMVLNEHSTFCCTHFRMF